MGIRVRKGFIYPCFEQQLGFCREFYFFVRCVRESAHSSYKLQILFSFLSLYSRTIIDKILLQIVKFENLNFYAACQM